MGRIKHVFQFLSGEKTEGSGRPPYFLSFRSSSALIVITVNLAIFTDIFFYGLIVPVLPFALPAQVGIAQDQVQTWVSVLLAVYSAALFIGSPLAGIYADHTSSRRWPLILGLLALAGATFLLAFGNSVGLYILGRLLQGVSAAVVWSVGCALLVDTMGSSVGVAMGYVNISMSIALLLAPVVGGVVYNNAGYLAVYYVAFAVVGVDIVLRLIMIEKKVAAQWIHEPSASESETPSQGADKEALANSSDAQLPRDSCDRSGRQTAADTRGGGGQEDARQTDQNKHRGRRIMVLLRSPRLLAAMYGIVVESGILMGFDAVLALFVKQLFGWNSTAVAVLLLALFIPGLTAPLAGWLSDKYGAKWPSFAGFLATVPILICLRFVTENTTQHKVLLAFLLALAGFTLPFSMTPLMAEITYVIDAEEAKTPGVFGKNGAYGLGYGLFNMAFALGGIIGPIWAGYVVASAGWGTLGWSFGIWSASAAAVVCIWGASKPKASMPGDTVVEKS
ncbi:MFS transporter-like protein [Xylariaceae sp. FL0594]|nr:MFS transporter-like protein [Xylariaceae sp. FL0594]